MTTERTQPLRMNARFPGVNRALLAGVLVAFLAMLVPAPTPASIALPERDQRGHVGTIVSNNPLGYRDRLGLETVPFNYDPRSGQYVSTEDEPGGSVGRTQDELDYPVDPIGHISDAASAADEALDATLRRVGFSQLEIEGLKLAGVVFAGEIEGAAEFLTCPRMPVQRIPNPFGRRGSPAHQARVLEAEERLTRSGWTLVSGGSLEERAVKVAGGKIRYPDLGLEREGKRLVLLDHGFTRHGRREASRIAAVAKIRQTATNDVRQLKDYMVVFNKLRKAIEPALCYSSMQQFRDGHVEEDDRTQRMTEAAAKRHRAGLVSFDREPGKLLGTVTTG